MADVSGITAVRPGRNTQYRTVQYGGTVSAGQPIAPSGVKHVVADANASETAAAAEGIAITPGVADGWGIMAFGGPVVLVGATLVVGETYYVSRTAGGIMPSGDVQAGDYVTRLGTASTATQLELSIEVTGILRA